MLIEVLLHSQDVLDNGDVRPLDLNMLSHEQSVVVAGCNHQ
jgi:hypothetical protein